MSSNSCSTFVDKRGPRNSASIWRSGCIIRSLPLMNKNKTNKKQLNWEAAWVVCQWGTMKVQSWQQQRSPTTFRLWLEALCRGLCIFKSYKAKISQVRHSLSLVIFSILNHPSSFMVYYYLFADVLLSSYTILYVAKIKLSKYMYHV